MLATLYTLQSLHISTPLCYSSGFLSGGGFRGQGNDRTKKKLSLKTSDKQIEKYYEDKK